MLRQRCQKVGCDERRKTLILLKYPQDAQNRAIHDVPFRFKRVSLREPNKFSSRYGFLAGLYTLSMRLELATNRLCVARRCQLFLDRFQRIHPKEVIKQLQFSEIIIQIHNWIDDFETRYAQLLRDLAEYFNIEKLEPIERNTANFSELRSYTDDNRLLLVSERRPCLMRFLKLTPLKIRDE